MLLLKLLHIFLEHPAMPKKTDDSLGADLLYGAEQIAAYLGRSPAWVYYQQANLGIAHVGAQLVGSKSKLKSC